MRGADELTNYGRRLLTVHPAGNACSSIKVQSACTVTGANLTKLISY